MAKSLNDFIAATRTGLANTSHFDVYFTKPGGISSQKYSTEEIEKVFLFCESTSLPGMNYMSTDIRTFGEVRKVPYERFFDSITLNFLVDKNMKVKMFFDDWMASIQNPDTRTFSYYSNYTTIMKIKSYDRSGNAKYAVELHEVYPTSIGAIEVSSSSAEVMRVSVTFNYRFWKSKQMQTLGYEATGLESSIAVQDITIQGNPINRTLVDRIFEVPNKVWNAYINSADIFRNLL